MAPLHRWRTVDTKVWPSNSYPDSGGVITLKSEERVTEEIVDERGRTDDPALSTATSNGLRGCVARRFPEGAP